MVDFSGIVELKYFKSECQILVHGVCGMTKLSMYLLSFKLQLWIFVSWVFCCLFFR